MTGLPIFDALSHPTLSGRWLGRDLDATFESLSADLSDSNFCGACAVGLSGVEGYDHDRFARACREQANLVPVAGIDPTRDSVSPREMERLSRLGFRGVKLHPRFAGLTRDLNSFSETIRAATDVGLVVFYCTYQHCAVHGYPLEEPFYALARLLDSNPDTRMLLVHGGDVRLLEYAEMVRFNPNLLLDLSLTLMKYPGSSVDLDIAFLFQQFDRRICIGTDHPEYSHAAVRRRFDQFAANLAPEKAANVAHRNIESFLRLESSILDIDGSG